MIIESLIACVVIAVYSYLQFEHLEGCEIYKQVAIDCELWQWENILVGAFLIIEGIVPVENPYFKFLIKPCREYLNVSSILFGKR